MYGIIRDIKNIPREACEVQTFEKRKNNVGRGGGGKMYETNNKVQI